MAVHQFTPINALDFSIPILCYVSIFYLEIVSSQNLLPLFSLFHKKSGVCIEHFLFPSPG